MKTVDLDKINIALVELNKWNAVDLSEVEIDSNRMKAKWSRIKQQSIWRLNTASVDMREVEMSRLG